MEQIYENLPKTKLPIKIQKFVDHVSRKRVHWHEEIEILYFIRGEAVTLCNLKEISVRQGNIIFINSKELHTGILRGRGTVYYCIHINTDFFHNLTGNEYFLYKNLIDDEFCRTLLEKVILYSENSDCKSILLTKKFLLDFFIYISEHYKTSVADKKEYLRAIKQTNTVNGIIEYINAHYNEDLNVPSLAEHFFMSTSYFAHIFKKHFGKSVMQYINELRISHACSFLESEELSVSDIACRTGFSDINYFSRKFKSIMGMTPTEYKKDLISNK